MFPQVQDKNGFLKRSLLAQIYYDVCVGVGVGVAVYIYMCVCVCVCVCLMTPLHKV